MTVLRPDHEERHGRDNQSERGEHNRPVAECTAPLVTARQQAKWQGDDGSEIRQRTEEVGSRKPQTQDCCAERQGPKRPHVWLVAGSHRADNTSARAHAHAADRAVMPMCGRYRKESINA